MAHVLFPQLIHIFIKLNVIIVLLPFIISSRCSSSNSSGIDNNINGL